MIIKGAKWGRKCARKSEKIQRRPIIVSVDVPGIQIDKSIAQTKKIIPNQANADQKEAHAPFVFLSIVPRSLASLSRSRRGSIPRSCVAAWLRLQREFVFVRFLVCGCERKNGRLGCTSEREKNECVLSTERKYASGMVLVLNIINKINGFGVLNPESASHS